MASAKRVIRISEVTVEVVRAVDRFFARAVMVAWCTLALAGVMAAWQIFGNREAPFVVISVEPAAAKPGDTVTIRAAVSRDVGRKCSASWHRFMWLPGSGRVDISNDNPTVGPEFIEYLESIEPGRLTISERVPDIAQPGQAMIVTELGYWCKPAQKWYPIQVTTKLPFTVLPP